MSMNCKYCGNPIDADDLFCTGCGKKIEENFNAYTQKTQGYVPQQEEKITPVPEPVPETPQEQQAPQHQQAQQTQQAPPPQQEQTQQAPPPEQEQTQQAPPPPYQQAPRAGYVNQNSTNEPLTLGKCILGLVLLCIPFVNIVCLFVWAFSGSSNTNAKNIARTLLIAGALSIALLIGGFTNFIFQFNTFTDLPTETIEEVAPTMPWERLDLLFDVSEL